MNISPRSLTAHGTLDWQKTSQSLSEAIQRINSGKKIISPADDPHGITEADKTQTNQGRILSANKAIDTGLSYVQTAQGLLTELQGTLDRMSEVATQVNSSPLGASERGNYNYEFNQLASQLVDILGSDNAQRFDIVNGFKAGDTFTVSVNGDDFTHTVEDGDNRKTIRKSLMDNILADATASARVRVYEGPDESLMISSADTTQELTLESSATSAANTAVINQGSVAGKPGGMFNGMELFAEKAGNGPQIFVGEVEPQTYVLPEAYLRVAENLVQLAGRSFDFDDPALDTTELVQIVKGAQDEAAEAIGDIAGAQNALSRFKASNETTLQNLESALSRFMDADIAEESSKMAKYNILSQSAIAMLAQANFGPQNVLSLLK